MSELHSLNPDHILMRQALTLSRKALPHDVPVGALIVYQNKIVGQGYNTRERDQTPLGHAELTALQQAAQTLGRWRLTDCTLYVTLEPCPMCAEAIRQSRISRVVLGATDPLNGACGSRYHLLANSRDFELVVGIEEEACQEELRAFFQAKRD